MIAAGAGLALACVLLGVVLWFVRGEHSGVSDVAQTKPAPKPAAVQQSRADIPTPAPATNSVPAPNTIPATKPPAASLTTPAPVATSAQSSLQVTPNARPAPVAGNGDRIALVIGNANYPDAITPLKEPVNDAYDLAEELKRDGFSVDLGEDLTGDAMRRAFDQFYGRIKPGSTALVFFSGFGVQSGRKSYLIPVDAQIWSEEDVRRYGFSLEAVLGEINDRGAGVKIALIDASRRTPFERRFRTSSMGLAPTIAPNGTLLMYSASLNSVISDDSGAHGLFVQELLKEIRVPDLIAEEALNRTRIGINRASHGEQIPWISSSLANDFSFSPPKNSSSPPKNSATR
jgi:Caspase domain